MPPSRRYNAACCGGAGPPSCREGLMGELACQGVSKIWGAGTDREVVALEDIDIDVRSGEFLVIIGPSGCGKSTLVKMLAGLEPPTAGRLLHIGQAIAGPDVNRSLIFQQPSLYPWLSARENVAFGLKLQGMPRAERQARALEFLRQVGLRDFADKHSHELSGGMQQRVAIARAPLCGRGHSPDGRALRGPRRADALPDAVVPARHLARVG